MAFRNHGGAASFLSFTSFCKFTKLRVSPSSTGLYAPAWYYAGLFLGKVKIGSNPCGSPPSPFGALRTLPKLKIILGKFQPREVTCRGTCKEKYMVPEEKKTDVNIAVEIMSDAFANLYDALILVSGDSDTQPLIQWVNKNRPEKKITVYTRPAKRTRGPAVGLLQATWS